MGMVLLVYFVGADATPGAGERSFAGRGRFTSSIRSGAGHAAATASVD